VHFQWPWFDLTGFRPDKGGNVRQSSLVLVEHGELKHVDRHTAPDFDVEDEEVICGDEQDPVAQEGRAAN
jgi:hypothetical protein